jgi:hypothetical protein
MILQGFKAMLVNPARVRPSIRLLKFPAGGLPPGAAAVATVADSDPPEGPFWLAGPALPDCRRAQELRHMQSLGRAGR